MTKNSLRKQAREVLELSRSRDEWDEMPMLFVFNEVPGDEHWNSIIVALAGGHPVEMLKAFSMGALTGEGGMDTEVLTAGELAGLALFTEGWAIMRDPKDPEREAKIEAFMETGKPYSEFDGALEQKSVDYWDGKEYGRFTYTRDADAIESLEGMEFDGLIVQSLKLTFQSLELARIKR